MFDVAVSIENRTVLKDFDVSKDAVLYACAVIADDCFNLMAEHSPEQRDCFMDKLVDSGCVEVDALPDVPHIRIKIDEATISVRLESERRTYRYASVGVYSNACARTIMDEGSWGSIAYDLLRLFCIREG